MQGPFTLQFSSVHFSSVAIIELNFAAVPMPITVTVATAPSWSLCVFTLPKRTFNTSVRLLKTPGTRSSVSLLNYITHFAYTDSPSLWFPGTIGNICGIIAGFSLIGICELLFFLAKQLWHACKAELKAELGHSHGHARSRHRTNGRSKGTHQRQQQQQQQQERQPLELLILP